MSFRRLSLATLVVTLLLPARASLLAGDEAMLLVPAELHAGSRSAATITALDPSGAGALDRRVTLHLSQGEARTLVAEGLTGPDGHARLEFDVPAVVDGASATLVATIDGIAQTLSASTTISSAPAILIETDKPIYKPGQTLQGRLLLLDSALRPRQGEVEVSISDAKGIRVHRETLGANEFGVAPFSLALAREVNFGVWKIEAESEGVETSRDVRVENYVLPRYELGASFERSWVLVDETIQGTVEARYFFGKDVAGTVEIAASRYIGDWEIYATTSGELVDGAFEFTLPAAGFVAGTPGAGGLGTVTLDITATDTTGHTQTTKELLAVSRAPVVLTTVSKQSSIKPGMPALFLLTSESPDGAPADSTVHVTAHFFDYNATTLAREVLDVTTEFGVANLSFDVPEGAARVELHARTEVDGYQTSTSLELSATWSPTSSFLSVIRNGSQNAAKIGEALSFTATATAPGSVFYEVYAAGRTVFSDVTRDREIRFTVTPEMAPSARLVAYVINNDNEVAADTVPFDVEIPTTVTVTSSIAGGDGETLSPGEEITLTIDVGERAMIGLAIVDNSVLALGRSRLHLGEVFAELERRFMEPRGEVHDDGHGREGPDDDVFWGGGWHTPGAAEIIEDVGLVLVVTDGLRAPQGNDLFFDFDAVAEDGPPQPGPRNGEDGGSDAGAPVRVRQFFPETWVWNPTLLTDENGVASLTLTVPDSITSWAVSTVASTSAGIGFGDSEAVVFQDFFVEPDIPVAVTRGEEFPIRVQIYNYLDVAQTVDLEFEDADWLELLGETELSVDVPAGAAISADFPIRPTELGSHDVKLVARGSVLSDAVIRKLTVEPEGEPAELVWNSVIEAGTTVPLSTALPEYTISGSGRSYLHITPSPIAQTMSGLAQLIHMPSGCGEQNMISLAPDVEILRYLNATDSGMPDVRAQAEHFINVGYQRELTFQTDDGGFAAFGGEQGSLWLTAFVLSTFSVARDVRDIDENVLSRSADMLVGRQRADGSFQTDDFLIHKEMDGGLSNDYAMAAYVANALADYASGGTADEGVLSALARAANYVRDERTTVNDDPYPLSIAAVALGKIAGSESIADAIIDRLLELAIQEGVGIHWEPYPVETTGYVAMALLARNRPEAAAAVDWLSTTRNSLGGYGHSTQDTVVAIRALAEAALKIRADLDVTMTVREGETTLASLTIDASNYDILQSVELPANVGEGLTLESSGQGNVGFQVARKFHVPAAELPPPNDMWIEVVYDADGIAVDDIVDVRVRVQYTGAKEKTGMTLIDIGVPTGFQTMRSTLDALLEEGVASRVEVAGRKVIFYIDELTSGETLAVEFQVKALYPVRAEAPVSKIYEYYDAEVQASMRGHEMVISAKPSDPSLFTRGDANADTLVDISDPVRILDYLFVDARRIDCEDRADVNDDGAINITDPIVLLAHLFQGGEAPPEPFPDAGEDPTPDGLRCE